MNLQQLIERLRYFLNNNNGIGAAMYFVLRLDGETVIRFADIENTAKTELKNRFLEYITERFIDNDELSYQNISQADGRANSVYIYDIDERPDHLNILDEILENEIQVVFNFNEDSLEHLQGYLITIGNEINKIALYKKHYPVNILKQDRFLLIPRDNRLVKIQDNAIALDKSFDFMMVDDNLIVLKLNTLERFFGFEEVIRRQAEQIIDLIDGANLLENIAQLNELAANLTNAKKLMKMRTSPVLNIPVANIITFINNHTELTGKIGFNNDRTRINLTTNVSKKLFLKILNDDYLFSQLTEVQYDTFAKDRLIPTKAECVAAITFG